MAKKVIYPLDAVTVNDDRYARPQITVVDDAVRAAYFDHHKTPLPLNTEYLVHRDGRGRIIMERFTLPVKFTGVHLQNAIRRAKRWLRNGDRTVKPAGHIGLALMAYAMADPASYQLELSA